MTTTNPVLSRDDALRLNGENAADSMHFTPYRGYCWNCHNDLVEYYGREAYASGINITGCPFCHRSYCD